MVSPYIFVNVEAYGIEAFHREKKVANFPSTGVCKWYFSNPTQINFILDDNREILKRFPVHSGKFQFHPLLLSREREDFGENLRKIPPLSLPRYLLKAARIAAFVHSLYLFICNLIQFKQPFGGFVWWGWWLLADDDDVDGEWLAGNVVSAGAILTIV